LRGLLDLLAKVLEIVDTVEVTHPQRMLRFTKYLASVEQVMGLEKSSLQVFYAESLSQHQRDAILEDFLGEHIYTMVTGDSRTQWSGTPAELLSEISSCYPEHSAEKRKLPATASALSKRLRELADGLKTQGIDVEFGRTKARFVSITNTETHKDSKPTVTKSNLNVNLTDIEDY